MKKNQSQYIPSTNNVLVTKNSHKIIGLKETKSDSSYEATRWPYEIDKGRGWKKLNTDSFNESLTTPFVLANKWTTFFKKRNK